MGTGPSSFLAGLEPKLCTPPINSTTTPLENTILSGYLLLLDVALKFPKLWTPYLMLGCFADLVVQFGAQIIGSRMQTAKTGPCNRIGT